jgi:glyoxylase-like metal-dependent hydrolase (beta-lactamase superfamily II)
LNAIMTESLQFDREQPAGELESLTPLVRRLVAPNPGPFTFTGTCSYLIGRRKLALIDPGPDDDAHVEALLHTIRGETLTHILVTHTHRDHSPAARRIAEATGARIVGCAPHHAARDRHEGEEAALDASNDTSYRPHVALDDGDVVAGPGWTLTALATPGHTANHLCFALREENALFSGDHVMAWSTSIVAPPNGAMGPYMASLDRLRARDEEIYWPGHGGPVRDPARFVRALMGHRRQREAAILRRLAGGDTSIGEIVAAIYEGLSPALHGAAALSVLAHLEDMTQRGLVVSNGPPTLASDFSPA